MIRAMRVLHGGILLGLVIIAGVVGTLVRLRQGPILGQVKNLAPITAGVGASLLLLALAVLRTRIPDRPAEQSPEEFWQDPNVRGLAVVLWAAIEGSGIVSAVGYLFTGGAAPAVVGGVAILALLAVRPSRLDSM